ncbi:MAG: helix-turn-helix domain-containing protein [Lachnospiraceae bacterium]|nr:helix-turn-helix domain-containing protein [Lachnospiraceae bacterium]
MTQKEFSERTGISQSAISDWKRKKTNPVSEKILIICETLGITPEELLSGVEQNDGRRKPDDYFVVGKNSELGDIIEQYNKLDQISRSRLMGYIEALGIRKQEDQENNT